MSLTTEQIYKSPATIHEEVLTNIVKMLAYRKWISNDKEYIKKIINDMVSDKNENKIYTISLRNSLLDLKTYDPYEDKTTWKNFDGKSIVIFLYNHPIKAMASPISEFLSKYANYHKIIVVKSITDKIRQKISKDHMHTEVFEEVDFLISIFEMGLFDCEVLSNEEGEVFLESYKLTRRQMAKIFVSDHVARKLYLKRGQIIRILHLSEGTCFSITYRITIHNGSSAI
jgi:DNA-directed RNA polymerase subunit H (RpoH/RPB5)